MSDLPQKNPQPPAAPKRRLRRRIAWTAAGILLILLGATAMPFLFPGTVVRFLVAHSAYRDLPLHFASASLSPWGSISVRGVVIGDQRESAGKTLAQADAVRVTFSWSKLAARRLKTIRVENIDLTLRPGDDTPLTLLRLFSPGQEAAAISTAPQAPAPTIAAATAPASAAAPEPGLWFDELIISGNVRVEGYAPWQDLSTIKPGAPLPAQLTVTSAKTADGTARDFSLTLGQPDSPAQPALVAHVRLIDSIAAGRAQSAWQFDSVDLSNVIGHSRLTAAGRYNTTAGQWESATLRLRDLAGADVSNVPGGVGLKGQIAGDLEYTSTAQAGGNLALTINATDPAATVAEGTAVLAGSPTLTVRAAYDRANHLIHLQTARLQGIDSLTADAGILRYFSPDPSGVIQKNLAAGLFAALQDLSVTGDIDTSGKIPTLHGNVALQGLALGKTADAPMVKNAALTAAVVAPLSVSAGTQALSALSITGGTLTADKLAAGQNSISAFSAALSAAAGKAQLRQIAFSFDDGSATGDAAFTLPAQIDSVHLAFTHVDQNQLTQALYPSVFTAEGHVSAKLTLDRQPHKPLTGSIDLTSDEPGRLKISRETSQGSFGPAAKAVAQAPGSMLPPNFDEIAIGQLANYPYQTGHLVVRDDPAGLLLLFDYKRVPLTPGEPGYGISAPVAGQQLKANFAFQLGSSVTLHNQSVTGLMQQFLGIRNSILQPPASRPAMATAASAPATSRP